jgi:hypothetical protein
MKIIISSKEFKNCLEKAVIKKCNYVNINCLDKEMVFVCSENDFSTKVHIYNATELTNFAYPFNALKIFKVIQFLNMLKQQPVVVEFDLISCEEADITITQTIFKV